MILSVEAPKQDGDYSLELIGPKPDWPKLAPRREGLGLADNAEPGRGKNPSEAHARPGAGALRRPCRPRRLRHSWPLKSRPRPATSATPSASSLHLPLRGAPRGRREDILRALLNDRERILRYLLLVLAETGGASALAPDVIEALSAPSTTESGVRGTLDLPLLEGLLRALDADAKAGADRPPAHRPRTDRRGL